MPDRLTNRRLIRYRLFDSYGLPWTSSLNWCWLYVITLFTGFAFAFLLGIYLGIWLKNKGKGASVLFMYLAVTALAVSLFFVPDRAQHIVDIFSGAMLILWFAAAYLLRNSVIAYYSDLEGAPFKINSILAGFFSVWYINGCLRAEFPIDETGKTPAGILKLTV